MLMQTCFQHTDCAQNILIENMYLCKCMYSIHTPVRQVHADKGGKKKEEVVYLSPSVTRLCLVFNAK